ncbi:MAG: hypothetical protein L3K02_09655, partial [Thermoplasmata archaeon]|nr:hypothetical protein [Thermoplasmata archaeon]
PLHRKLLPPRPGFSGARGSMGGSATANATSGPSSVTFDRLPPSWEPTSAVPRLPIGVAVVSVLIALAGVVMVLGGILFLLGELGSTFFPSALDLFPSIDLLGSAILVVATSLWRQETWALWTTLLIVFGTTVYLFFTGSITILFVLLVVLFVYLLSVRRYFY